MTARVTRLADRLVAHLVPQAKASAAYQCECVGCRLNMPQKRCRDCIRGVCEPWVYYGCDTC